MDETTASLWPEDTVEYRIYCQPPRSTEGEDDALAKLALECSHASRQLSGHHVWYYATFVLRPGEAGEREVHSSPWPVEGDFSVPVIVYALASHMPALWWWFPSSRTRTADFLTSH